MKCGERPRGWILVRPLAWASKAPALRSLCLCYFDIWFLRIRARASLCGSYRAQEQKPPPINPYNGVYFAGDFPYRRSAVKRPHDIGARLIELPSGCIRHPSLSLLFHPFPRASSKRIIATLIDLPV